MIKRKGMQKQFIILLVSLLILILISVLLFYSYNNNKEQQKKLNRLSDVYSANLDNTNGIQGADTIFRDEEGNIIKEYKGTSGKTLEKKEDKENTNKKADQVISNFVSKINSKDYDSLYAMFNKDYINVFEYTLDTFKSQYAFDGKVVYEITNVEEVKTEGRLIINVKFTESKTGYIMLKDFTLFSDGTISDLPFYLEATLNKEVTVDDVTFKVKKRYKTRLGSIYSLEIDNNSNKLIDVKNMRIKNNSINATYDIISKNKQLKAYPGQPFSFLIKLPNIDNITSLEVRYPELDGTIKKVEIYSEK